MERVRSRFYDEFFYPLKHFRKNYLDEIKNFSVENCDAPQRGARLSALTKNYKTSEMLVFVLQIALDLQLDLTPLVVKRLNNALFGRTGSQCDIVALFGSQGRVHRSKDANPERITFIAEQYKFHANQHWQQCLLDIQAVKSDYKAQSRQLINANVRIH
ncbi:cytoplasmic protein (plasmid) [Photobacterium damselae subsp. piscicida]|uniref:Cytoplasmic protein n=1 Tax=Photobacterium damsela subsp. piscicida TaxID=38294 RepID=A0A5F0YQA2_PHODP|nr:cytoplasmic protein [Photobacterium damselae subsp. piscicida]PSW76198.1 cytoplasmic protein [Photobacterium damselae]QOD55311.1 cytoplasmic protein [Photobacterium damselae subsp. piscicida]QOD59136.1 cytoplasmic protein [Photobacterium damselae subsp. piscicida]